MPYLRSYEQERLIYDTYVVPQVRRHVAPHATEMAAALRGLHPHAQAQPRPLLARGRRHRLDAHGVEKADLYALGKAPERLDADSAEGARVARSATSGPRATRTPSTRGASARARARCASRCSTRRSRRRSSASIPLAVLDEIEALCQRKNEFEWLQQDSIVGGYHDVKGFRDTLLTRLLVALGVRALRRRAGSSKRSSTPSSSSGTCST